MSDLGDKTEYELANIISGHNETSPLPSLAKQELQRRIIQDQHRMNKENIELQDKYNKQQIELQHERNTELVKEQLKWVRYAAYLNVVAIISGVLLGWFLQIQTQKLQKAQSPKVEQERSNVPQTKKAPMHPSQPPQ